MIPKVNLKSCITNNIASWAELEARIASLPFEQQRGEVFEEFCKAFFLLEPVFQFKEVYHQAEIPPSLREHLGYPGIKDLGIDGIGVTQEGKVFAYQAKFRTDRNSIPTLRELSTFFTLSDHADWRITITNANNLPPAIDKRQRQSRILADRFDNLDPGFFSRLALYLEENRVIPPTKKVPHVTQQQAIDTALSHYATHTRGQLILPCGAGKTLASLWITEKLGGKFILVMVPSLALLSQTLREWANNTSIHPFRYLCVCSDTTVDLGNDSPIEHLYEFEIPPTTEFEEIHQFLSHSNASTTIIFSTYQSSKVLSRAVKAAGIVFDVGIFDEAHRTTGTEVGTWSMALDDENIPVKRRIFMTATPRIYAPHITKKARENDIAICSMDDHVIYGEPFCEVSFQEAIDRDHITDYKVVVICVTDAEVKSLIEQGGRVIIDAEHEWDANAFAKRVALAKGIRAYGLRKVFTFHGRVDGAKAFTNPKTHYGIHNVFKTILPQELLQKDIGLFHVNGAMSSGQRNSLLHEFAKVHTGVMSNARCLIEGINVPAVDTVAFIDPKRSLIDIVQATGRALRKAEWKEKGYIFIPVVVDEDSEPEEIVTRSDFDTVWRVLQAMVDQDHRLQSIVEHMRVMQGEQEEHTQAWKDAMRHCTEKIEFYDLPARIERNRFINKLYTKIIEIIGRSWDFWYGLTLQYKNQYGDPNVPFGYRTPDGYRLGRWQGHQRESFKKDTLSHDRVQRLEAIGFKWDLIDELFEKAFQETLKYRELTGDPNAPLRYKTPEGYTLGGWQNHQRVNNKKGELSSDRVQRLEAIGFKWVLLDLDKKFEKGFQETLKYRELTGDPNAPAGYRTPEGYTLGQWQSYKRGRYKKGKLSSDRVQRLEAIGFKWVLLDEPFEKGFQETLKYRELTGDPNAPVGYRTPKGYGLGMWQSDQRKNYKKDDLSHDRVQRLVAIGFKWVLLDLDKKFGNGFQETLKYRELTGDPNAPQGYKTPDGYRLGAWQSSKRGSYKKGQLSSDEVQRLEAIGFKWVLLDLDRKFEKGFQETLKYRELTGDPNAPARYRTPEGYGLGGWQGGQRTNYKKDTLSHDRVQRLEAISFKWRISNNIPNRLGWDFWYDLTLRYKDQYGDPNAPAGYRTPEGHRLGKWQSHQRRYYKKGKLSHDRVQRLEAIGFKWRISKTIPNRLGWDSWYDLTLRYKDQYGDPNAPKGYKTPEGYELGMWQADQRKNYKKDELSYDRVQRLEAIDFRWALFGFDLDKKFEKGFQETLKYRELTGDPNAPAGYRTPEGYRLGGWQSHQRGVFKKEGLSHDRVQRLEAISFKWRISDNIPNRLGWDSWYDLTLRYKDQYGDPNAPAGYRTPEGYELGVWQSYQRRCHKRGKLSSHRVQRLEAIDFRWALFGFGLDKKFEKGFQETLKYRELTGDANAPRGYKTPEGYGIGVWQSRQRGSYKKSKLSSDRVQRLEAIGFKWRIGDNIPNRLGWDFWYDLALRYKDQYGDPNAPARYRTPEGHRLGQWQSGQRESFKKEELSHDRVQRLEAIGVKWVLRDLDKKFEKGFQETLKYRELTGDPNAPAGYRTPEGYGIGVWQSRQRGSYKKSKLSSDRVQRLEAIGFKWRISKTIPNRLGWDFWYDLTLRYKDQYGDPNAPAGYRTPEGHRLGKWQSHQRGSFKKEELSHGRVQGLEAIGFKWVLLDLDKKFEKGLQETLKYRELTGDANAPRGYKTLEGHRLGKWQSRQRGSYKKGKLSTQRIGRLEKIGFIFDKTR